MWYRLSEIKRLRKKLGLNQKELAADAGVSQSLIAKIEAGRIEPTYNKACQIIEALQKLEEKGEIKAKDLMNKRVVFARPEDKVKDLIRIMKQKGISQIPVLRGKVVCGVVSEKIILDVVAEGKSVGGKKAEEIMDDCPPIISLETSQKTVLEILREHSVVLVAERGEVKGLVSKSDVLNTV